MAYRINYKSSVEKDIRSISKEEISRIFDKIESDLLKNPFAYPKLKGEFKSLRKFRIGKYRIVYTVNENEIIKIKDKLAKRVYKLSRETQKDTSYHLNKALENYLDETDELKDALKRLNNKRDKVISSKDFRSSLGV